MDLRLSLLLVFCVGVCLSEKARYDNYQVHRIIPKDKNQLDILRDLEKTDVFSFWRNAARVNVPVDVLVAPHQRPLFSSFVEEHQLTDSILVQDVQKRFDEEEVHMKSIPKPKGRSIDFRNYYRLDDIYDWQNQLASENSNVQVVSAGKSFEGRDILGLNITFGSNLPGVILESGIHAREWIAPAASAYIIDQILSSPEDSIYRQYNYIYFPITNPDGYEFTHTDDRAWRKTRQPYRVVILTCYGADPNRNWDFHWMEGGSSGNACTETYAGPEAFSEPETKALSDFFKAIGNQYDIYVGFHSFSQLLMYPWGYTGEDTPLEGLWKRVGTAAANDLKAVHGTSFEVGSIYDTIYQASGSSLEWYYGNFNSTFTFVFELRDTGDYGFTLPPEQIIPSGEELIAAINRFLVEYPAVAKKPIKK